MRLPVLLLVFCVLNGFSQKTDAQELRFSTVPGGGNIPLNVVEAGASDGHEILFIHGVSQSYLSWHAQLTSEDLQKFRLVAFDLRGHGNSAKPWSPEDYTNANLWADDVASVISEKKLNRPTIVAWSYGGLVLMDYIRHYGTENVAAINLVANTASLIDYIPDPKPGDELIMQQMAANQPRQQSLNIIENLASVRFAVPLLTEVDMGDAWRRDAHMITMMTPSYVRRALAKRKIDNKDLRGVMNKIPILLSYGSEDGSVTQPMAAMFKDRLPQTQFSVYQGIGHSPFAEASGRYNRELMDFAGKAVASDKN